MNEKKPPSARSVPADKSAGGESSLAKSVGSILRSAREAQGLSQSQVASLTGTSPGQISRTAISDIECGKHLPSLEALVSLSRVLHIDSTEILERVDLAMTVPVDVTGLSFADLELRASKFFHGGDFASALAVYDAMYEHLVLDPPDDDMEKVRRLSKIEITRASTLRRLSALKASRASAERATEIARDIPELRSEAYMVLAALHSHEGLHGLALDAASRAVELSEAGDDAMRGRAWCHRGVVLYRAREFAAAREAYLHARKFGLEAQDHRQLIAIEGGLGACLIDLGESSKARSHLIKAVELARKHADREAEALWLAGLGRLAFDVGELDEAERCAVEALRIARPANRKLTVFAAEWLRHLIVHHRNPDDPDTKRIEQLRKLYTRIKEHKGLDQVQEFKTMIIDANWGTTGGDDE